MSSLNCKDLTGQRFDKVIVLYRARDNHNERVQWMCICDCGRLALVARHQLLTNKSINCGCIAKLIRENPAEYTCWTNMRTRCGNPNVRDKKNYSERGISIDHSWNKFENFLSDMGKRPSKDMSLDRINNDLGYSKANCRWATITQQANNKQGSLKFEYAGHIYSPREFSELTGLNYRMSRYWFAQGKHKLLTAKLLEVL